VYFKVILKEKDRQLAHKVKKLSENVFVVRDKVCNMISDIIVFRLCTQSEA